MINKVFDLGDAKAKDVMVPRVHVVMAEVDSTYKDLLEIFREEKFTRIPIYQDKIDNIIGIVNMKDLLMYDDFHILICKRFFVNQSSHMKIKSIRIID